MPFVAERGVSALGGDGNSDTAPSTTEGIDFPVHALALNAMGVHLFDYLQLEDLLAACERAERWEFLFVAAPLRITGGNRLATEPSGGPLIGGRLRSRLRWSPPRRAGALPGSPCGSGST